MYLVFLLDESGSMGDGKNGDRTKKWDPVTAALNAFFADPESAGITASLSMFPLNKNNGTGAADQNQPADCAARAKYVDPEVMPTRSAQRHGVRGRHASARSAQRVRHAHLPGSVRHHRVRRERAGGGRRLARSRS